MVPIEYLDGGTGNGYPRARICSRVGKYDSTERKDEHRKGVKWMMKSSNH
jgi:hypothetical protein